MLNPQYEIEYSDERVTAWGGMRLMKEVLESSGVSGHLADVPLPESYSNRGYSPSVVVESYMVNVWLGCYRMSHTEVLRRDDTLKVLFGWNQTPSGSSYERFFNKFSQARNQAVFPTLQQRFLESIPLRKLTLDMDNSVIVRYGAQQGVARGYNSGKAGTGITSSSTSLCGGTPHGGQRVYAPRQHRDQQLGGTLPGGDLRHPWPVSHRPTACRQRLLQREDDALFRREGDPLYRRRTLPSRPQGEAPLCTLDQAQGRGGGLRDQACLRQLGQGAPSHPGAQGRRPAPSFHRSPTRDLGR